MKRIIVLAAALALALPALTFAQAKPDFSGTWKLDMTKSELPQRGGGGGGGGGGAPGGGGGGRGMGGGEITVKQTATEIVISQTMGDNTVARTYKLDGSEVTNPGGRGGEIKTKSKWDGAKLVTEWTQAGQQGEAQMKEELSMEGGNLVRATSRNSQPFTKLVYTKSGT
jgi:hypothetical protein